MGMNEDNIEIEVRMGVGEDSIEIEVRMGRQPRLAGPCQFVCIWNGLCTVFIFKPVCSRFKKKIKPKIRKQIQICILYIHTYLRGKIKTKNVTSC